MEIKIFIFIFLVIFQLSLSYNYNTENENIKNYINLIEKLKNKKDEINKITIELGNVEKTIYMYGEVHMNMNPEVTVAYEESAFNIIKSILDMKDVHSYIESDASMNRHLLPYHHHFIGHYYVDNSMKMTKIREYIRQKFIGKGDIGNIEVDDFRLLYDISKERDFKKNSRIYISDILFIFENIKSKKNEKVKNRRMDNELLDITKEYFENIFLNEYDEKFKSIENRLMEEFKKSQDFQKLENLFRSFNIQDIIDSLLKVNLKYIDNELINITEYKNMLKEKINKTNNINDFFLSLLDFITLTKLLSKSNNEINFLYFGYLHTDNIKEMLNNKKIYNNPNEVFIRNDIIDNVYTLKNMIDVDVRKKHFNYNTTIQEINNQGNIRKRTIYHSNGSIKEIIREINEYKNNLRKEK